MMKAITLSPLRFKNLSNRPRVPENGLHLREEGHRACQTKHSGQARECDGQDRSPEQIGGDGETHSNLCHMTLDGLLLLKTSLIRTAME